MISFILFKNVYKNLIKFTLKYKYCILITLVIFFYYPLLQSPTNKIANTEKLPTVLIVSLIIRNKAHTLPYFFSCLENLDYPKSRLSLLFQLDHNEDKSIELINLWVNRTSNDYSNVQLLFKNVPKRYRRETSQNDWTKERLINVIKLKEKALKIAQNLLADFIFFLDADVFLTNRDTLKTLTTFKLPIITPMLLSEGTYSSFLCNIDEYKQIYNRQKIGNFEVPLVHTAILINLNVRNFKFLTFDRQKLLSNLKINNKNNIELYSNTSDYKIVFSMSAHIFDIPMFITNLKKYGYILEPLEKSDEFDRDYEQFLNLKLNIINDLGTEIKIKTEFRKYIFYPEKNKLSLDHIYMINLERRPERRQKMELSFRELGLDVEHIAAVDGKTFNSNKIEEMGIKLLPGYKDPYLARRMTMGEIGCFLSHYKIWQKIIKLGQQEVLIFEDDIKFQTNFCKRAINVLNQARKIGNWDILYFGRFPLEYNNETCVKYAKNLVHLKYSYWTLGYVITLKGAKKLIDIKPLEKILPIDEFLPIMYNQHPNKIWSKAFETRNLLAYSAEPLLVYPTHLFKGDSYISDTEDSESIPIQYEEQHDKLVERKKSIKSTKI